MHSLSALFLLTVCSLAPAQPNSSNRLPGMPPIVDPLNIYSETTKDRIQPWIRQHPELIYVPNAQGNTVSVIDPKKMEVIRTFPVGKEPQHVVPSYDLKTLYATNDLNDTLSEIDPATGTFVRTIRVDDPYNMYYTPDGKYAIVVAERLRKLDFREPKTFKLVKSVPVPCKGVDHIDFSADGKYFLATCEFSGEVVKVDVAAMKVVGKISTPGGGMPQDIKLSPDGKTFYIADMDAHGVHMVDGEQFKVTGFIPTGKNAHGLYVSKDFKYMYVSNRGEGSVSLIDLATRKVATKWVIPGGGSPDMGNLSADGKIFWLSGRYHHVVYAIDTTSGKLISKIKVGRNPHGLCVWPQPGRYSIGHTGIMR
ncbi:MAG: beta-propeller fold lactonase family protein [Candidatus Solibacter usitatus]|nr:beta-propeller fold lactonase family protein [Candidatus Solibacter usitatus]